MFSHPHHQKVQLILESLNDSLLCEVGAYFGGGTLITLLHDEYRWSKDIDFICPVGVGYKRLRELVADNYFKPEFLFKKTNGLEFPRDLTANQYGVRFLALADGQSIKFEIVAENRITLEAPESFEWTDVPCLSGIDRTAEKLLANADRWNDSGVLSRDLIDLAVIREAEIFSAKAIEKAEAAYPVIAPLKSALVKFQNSKEYQSKCFQALEINNQERILRGIQLLSSDYF